MSGNAGRRRRKIIYRKKSQNRASMLLAITVMAVILIAVTVRGFTLRQKLQEYDEKKQQLQEEIASEQERSKQIEEYSKYTQTDEYVEEVARDKLGLVKKGETVFRRNGEDSGNSTTEEGAGETSDSADDAVSSGEGSAENDSP